jgi:rhodanese-related sulfurtransferase
MSVDVMTRTRLPDVVDLDLETFTHAIEDHAVTVVDVREAHEFAAGHIPEAINLPLSRFDPRDLPSSAETTVVLVCQAGVRSRKALDRARAAGRADLKHYAGGMAQWRAHGGAVAI